MKPGVRPVYATREFAERLKKQIARRYLGDGRIVVSATDDAVSISLADNALRGLLPTNRQIKWGRVTGFTTGPFGVANSALRVRPLLPDGTDASNEDITVYVRSYNEDPTTYGRVQLPPGANGAGGAYPLRGAGSRVWYMQMPYYDGVYDVDLETYFRRGC